MLFKDNSRYIGLNMYNESNHFIQHSLIFLTVKLKRSNKNEFDNDIKKGCLDKRTHTIKVARTIIRKDSGACSISGLKKWPKNAHLLSLVTRFVSFFDLAHDNRRKGHL